MKKLILIPLFLILMIACSVSSPSENFDDRTATQVSLVLTATALDQTINQQSTQQAADTVQPQPTATSTITPAPDDDPKKDLGSPAYSDDLTTGNYWSLDSGDLVQDNTTLSVKNGKLNATAAAIGKGTNWWLNYLTFQDAYLEAKFDIGNCSGDDQYGLVFRAPDYGSGLAYYFHVTCDGRYDLRRWSSSGATMLLGMKASDKIIQGANQTNILGVWVKDQNIRLYINDFLVEEINDSELTNAGHFGIFINARQTPGFSFGMDNMSYWNLN